MDRLSAIREMEACINNGTNENEFDCRVHILYDDLMELGGKGFRPRCPTHLSDHTEEMEVDHELPASEPRLRSSVSPSSSVAHFTTGSPFASPKSHAPSGNTATFGVPDPHAPPPDHEPSQRLKTPELDPPAPSPRRSPPSEREPSHRPTTPEFDDRFAPSPSRGPPSDRELSQRPKTPSLGTHTPSPPHNPPGTSEPPSQPKSPELEKWRQDAISMVAKAKFTNSSLRFYDDGKTVVECSRAMLEDLLGKVTAETLKDLEFARDFLIFATKVFGIETSSTELELKASNLDREYSRHFKLLKKIHGGKSHQGWLLDTEFLAMPLPYAPILLQVTIRDIMDGTVIVDAPWVEYGPPRSASSNLLYPSLQL
ncbi:uncharacterized protein J3D65DRAFT_688652 [Phyllosticta citribraziliensis]|uniref:Uncharacterized protein n=1 Tax=Phyllosticta citribraziliensis TaxID=989973 RepID=A0ABR1L3W8_9PEZI